MDLRTHYRRWKQYRQNLRELESCSDRELRDLGFSRADIHRVAREVAFACLSPIRIAEQKRRSDPTGSNHALKQGRVRWYWPEGAASFRCRSGKSHMSPGFLKRM